MAAGTRAPQRNRELAQIAHRFSRERDEDIIRREPGARCHPVGGNAAMSTPSTVNASSSPGSSAPRKARRGSVADMVGSVIHVYHESADYLVELIKHIEPMRPVIGL